MYCKNCGVKLEVENQRFCQNCGREIKIADNRSQLGVIRDPYKPISAPPPQYQVIEHTQIKKEGQHSYSKICLGFGIICFVIATISFNIGSTLILEKSTLYFLQFRRIFIGLIITHIIGLIFGIFSRINYSKAKELEPESSILKAGRVLGTLGIIINASLLLIALIIIGVL